MKLKEVKLIEQDVAKHESKIRGLQRKVSGLNRKKSELLKQHLLSFLKVGNTYTFKENLKERENFKYSQNYYYIPMNDHYDTTIEITNLGKTRLTYEHRYDHSAQSSVPGTYIHKRKEQIGYKNFCHLIYHFTVEGKTMAQRELLLSELLP